MDSRRNAQIWAQWFDQDGNGPQMTIVNGEWCATPLHVEWQVTCLRPSACIASAALGGLYMTTDDAREMASRLVEAADLADTKWARMEARGEPTERRAAHGNVGARTVRAAREEDGGDGR